MNTIQIETLKNNASKSTVPNDRLYFSPEIPPKKLINAKKAFGVEINDSDVLMLLDDTIIGNGKKGLILSSTTIYSRGQFGNPQQIQIDQINSITFKGGMLKDLYINDTKFLEISTLSSKQIKDIINILQLSILGPETDEKVNFGQKDNANINKQDKENNPTQQRDHFIQITGKINKDIPIEDVIHGVSGKFGLSTQQVKDIFSNSPIIIKRDLDLDKATRFKEAFEHIGVECVIGNINPPPPAPEPARKQTDTKQNSDPKAPKYKETINLSATSHTGQSLKNYPPKDLKKILEKINLAHYGSSIIDIHMPKLKIKNLKDECGIPKDSKIIAAIIRSADHFTFVIAEQWIFWRYTDKRYIVNFSDFATLDIEIQLPNQLNIGPSKGIRILTEKHLILIRDVLFAIQYFIKTKGLIPQDQMLYVAEKCPRCGSTQMFRTQKNKMNWKAGAAASLFGGPVLGAVIGSKSGEDIDVKMCNSCFYTEPISS